ncbi:MAG: nuclear transport factor 2 family protein [Gemmatimonadales bacterium]|jgi:ketosteroid isomerase-like protein
MRLGRWMVGAAALVFAAGCNKTLPMNDADRAALADSVGQMTTQLIASLGTRATATADNWLSHFVKGDALVHAEYGMIYPTYDSLVKVLRAGFSGGTTVQIAMDQKRVTVLDRDVVVFTTLLNGAIKDSAGKETPFHEAWTAVWHRTPDGWKIAADHESTAPPAPAPAKPKRRSH